MTSLEFIEKEIKYEKENIKLWTPKKETSERLNRLNQIKTELEAWEEIQKYLILNEGFVPLYDSFYEYLTLKNDCIDESNSEEEGESLTIIKKALEVKDE